jgi:ATP-dependent helicase/nuclease subunit A
MSKGLEFDHVIIPYLEKEPNRKYYAEYMCNEETGKWALALRFDKQTALTPLPLKKMLKSKTEEELKECHRLLYVAMTRAKKSLLLSSAGKPESDSWLKSMRIPLEVGTHSYGNFSYSVVSKIPVTLTAYDKVQKSDFILNPLSNVSQKTLEETSVTQKLKWLNQGVDHVVPLMKSALEGVRLHKIFETLKYKTTQEVLSQLDSKDREAVTWLLETSEIPFAEILSQGYAEWGFVVKTDAGTLSGQIDLWAQLQNSVWILDYKTGSSRYSDKALEQLRIYAEALKKKLNPQHIHLAAVYPFEKKIIRTDF